MQRVVIDEEYDEAKQTASYHFSVILVNEQ